MAMTRATGALVYLRSRIQYTTWAALMVRLEMLSPGSLGRFKPLVCFHQVPSWLHHGNLFTQRKLQPLLMLLPGSSIPQL
jgi:hypothetical protein